MLSDASLRFKIPSFRIFGFGRASVSGGVLIGTVFGNYLNATIDFSLSFVTSFSMVMIFIMIVTYIFTLTERDVAKLTERRSEYPVLSLERESSDQVSRFATFDDKVDIIAEEYNLSGRKVEVLRLLAKGRTGARIEQELYMSRGTVNTHMRQIYKILGVHTRQEILDKLDKL